MNRRKTRTRSQERRTGRVTRYSAEGKILPNPRKFKKPRPPHVTANFKTSQDPLSTVKPSGFHGIPVKDVPKKEPVPREPTPGTAPLPSINGRYGGGSFDINIQGGEFLAVITKLRSGFPIRLLNALLKPAVNKAVQAGMEAVKGGTGRAALSIFGEVKGGMSEIYSTMPDRVVTSIDRGIPVGTGMRHGPWPGPMLPGLIAWKDAVGYTGWAIQLAERIKMTGTKPKRFISIMGQTLAEEVNGNLPKEFDKEIEVWWYGQPSESSPDLTGTGFKQG